MIWFMLILGVAVGAGGYYLYDKYFSKAEAAAGKFDAKVMAELMAEIAKFKPKGWKG